jgi:hypothetical protein
MATFMAGDLGTYLMIELLYPNLKMYFQHRSDDKSSEYN